MHVAIMDSEHFRWVSVGKTEREAKGAILKEWEKDPARKKMTLSELEDYYGISVYKLGFGECFYE